MKTLKLYDLICAAAAKGLSIQQSDGSIPPGHNGPWQHRETPVRNTAHWALLFLQAYAIETKTVYREAARNACAFLMSDAALHKGFFYCRMEAGKDKTNNLIGQAWACESLAGVGHYLREDRFSTFAYNIIKKHRFDHRFSLWHKAHADKNTFNLCRTLNQQIMFAAMAL
ncbi:MAG: hypothetical protein GY765_02250, partial [bacterium]|nr:hypothetical protein [bacterium]